MIIEVLAKNSSDPIRKITTVDDQITLRNYEGKYRRGRPKFIWWMKGTEGYSDQLIKDNKYI